MWVRPLPSRKAAATNANIEVLIVPVADVDRALAFYTEKAGFTLDLDYAPTDEFRVV